ncbi:phenylalanyl-tRNA synthetase subunit alpha [Nitzschia inconspicua]|uniref:phenylalanine--tRNA ligase n=1 Tax=Nitzschia inconspicua TaxID=303405 RepID=A0A9K3LQJ3_9STRA|nr:phenylalanyl-tRNA synthetase subunit alpha [Nitzschia inconspicua]
MSTSTSSFNQQQYQFRDYTFIAGGFDSRSNNVDTRLFSTATPPTDNAALKELLTATPAHPNNNIPPHITERALMEPKLYQISPHPLYLIKKRIEDYFKVVGHNVNSDEGFVSMDSMAPIVTLEANFDSLLIPQDHVSRSPSDTYYINDEYLLRCHTSAHQVQLLKQGHRQFLCTGDVYRRDDIDRSHYPIFHQMEGVKVFDEDATEEQVLDDLKATLEGLAKHLFGAEAECRWVEEYFPFTDPSLELEVFFDGEWLEVLGCGVMRPEIVKNGLGKGDSDTLPRAWAFGLGLERLAMILFQIPDIRLFWSDDERFWKQFSEDMAMDGSATFQTYSKFPPVYKDVSFWLKKNENDVVTFHPNDLLDLVRGIAGDLAENVEMVDQFVNPKTTLESQCYRITYRSMDRSLTNEEIDELQENLRSKIESALADKVELR